MSKHEVSILLDVLDLEYLKPILIDRFEKIDQLASVNLQDIGVQNPDDLNKLHYALDQLTQGKKSIEQYDPILSLDDSNHIITRIENETNLVSSSLNFLLNNINDSNLPRDDATSDIDYSLYNSEINQIENDVEKLQNNVDDLIEQIQIQYPQLKQQEQLLNDSKQQSKQFFKGTLLILAVSVFSIGLMFYIKRK